MISNGSKFKRRKTQEIEIHPRDRSGSAIPPEKRKAKRRAKRKATNR